MQLEAADQTTLSSMLPHDDGMALDNLSLPDKPISLPLNDVSKRQMAHAYRLIKHKYGKGNCSFQWQNHSQFHTHLHSGAGLEESSRDAGGRFEAEVNQHDIGWAHAFMAVFPSWMMVSARSMQP